MDVDTVKKQFQKSNILSKEIRAIRVRGTEGTKPKVLKKERNLKMIKKMEEETVDEKTGKIVEQAETGKVVRMDRLQEET